MKTKDEVIGQNIMTFVLPVIGATHQIFVDVFIQNKKRFNNLLPLTFGRDIDGFINPLAVIVKLSTQCFESLSIAGFMKFEPEEDMYIITDMMGNIQGWTKSVHR